MLLSLVWSSKFLQAVVWAVSSQMPRCYFLCGSISPRRVASGRRFALKTSYDAHLLDVVLEAPGGSSVAVAPTMAPRAVGP